MPAYRLYCFDGARHIQTADWIEAETDEEALAKARAAKPCASVREIWLNDRLIGRIENYQSAIRTGSG